MVLLAQACASSPIRGDSIFRRGALKVTVPKTEGEYSAAAMDNMRKRTGFFRALKHVNVIYLLILALIIFAL